MCGAAEAVSLHCGKDVRLGEAALSFLQSHREGALWKGLGGLPRVSCHCPLFPWLQVLFGTPQRLEKNITKKSQLMWPQKGAHWILFLEEFYFFPKLKILDEFLGKISI